MSMINYASREINCKIVYYGSGLGGKTTNLEHIYGKVQPDTRGKLISLATETERTLFFDFLPVDLGTIRGFKTRFHLYTVPGQVYYNASRKLILKGVDGIVFVADSQVAMQDANLDSFKNLRDNLGEIGLDLDDIPLVLQLNKRDLPNVASVDAMLDNMDPQRRYEHIEAVAATGVGVFETLKLISKLTLRTLRRRMTGDDVAKPAAAAAPTGRFAAFRVKDDDVHATMSGTTSVATPVATTSVMAHEPAAETFSESTLAKTADVGASAMSEAPVAAAPAPEVKHVKVRSWVDIMAELESLRKRATAGTPPKPKKEPSPLDALLGKKPKRDIQKSLALKVPAEVLPKAKSLRVTVSFENSDGVLQTQEHAIDVSDASDAQSLSVNLRIDS